MPNQYTGPVNPLERLLAKVKKTDICWIWTGASDEQGRGIFFDGDKSTSVPRFVYRQFKGEIPEGLYVCHKCDNPSCVNPEHLWLGTQLDNMKDCQGKGRKNIKLSQEQREQIKQSMGTLKEIAEQFGVSFQYVSKLKRNIN